ncbi:MAG TPA: MlaD family protein [Candidatus Sumerlaeota bacterium]|nr:MlaD family protein [Candidatus Sumerlaeota bacterium]
MAMNASRKNEVIVGIFVLLAFAALFGLTFVIQGSTGMNPYHVRTQYPNVSGLEIGSPVLVQGFRTGRVIKMTPGERGPDGRATVVVTAEVSRSIPIYKNAEVKLVQQGFIGDKRLEIDPGTEEAGEIEMNQMVTGVPPTDLDVIIKKGQKMMDDLSVTLENVRNLTSDQERIAKIDATIANIQKSSDELRAMMAENREAIKVTVANVQELTEKGKSIADKTDAAMADAQTVIADFKNNTKELTEKVNAILAKADTASANANELMVSSKREIEELSDSLQKTSESLNKLVGGLNDGRGTVGMLLQDPRPFNDLQESVAAVRKILLSEQNDFYDRRVPYRGTAPAGATP